MNIVEFSVHSSGLLVSFCVICFLWGISGEYHGHKRIQIRVATSALMIAWLLTAHLFVSNYGLFGRLI
jgi:hypothetical protein